MSRRKRLTQDQYDDLCYTAGGLITANEGLWHRVNEHPDLKRLHKRLVGVMEAVDKVLDLEDELDGEDT